MVYLCHMTCEDKKCKCNCTKHSELSVSKSITLVGMSCISMHHSHSLFYKLVSAQKTGRANLISTTDRQKAPAAREVVWSETTLHSTILPSPPTFYACNRARIVAHFMFWLSLYFTLLLQRSCYTDVCLKVSYWVLKRHS